MLSDVLYRTYLHQWTCHPEQEDAIRARKTNEILSDVGPSSVHNLEWEVDSWTLLNIFLFLIGVLQG